MKTAPLLALALGLPTFALADEYTGGDLRVLDPVAFETPVTAKTGAGYLKLVNDGPTDDSLIEVQADFPKVMIHKSEEKDGIATMFHVDRIELPAGATVELAPGGFHVMFMGLGGDPLEVGEKFSATLIFEQAGPVEIEFTVEPRPGSHGQADHSGHSSTSGSD